MRSWDPESTPDFHSIVYAAAVATLVAQTQSHAGLEPGASVRVLSPVQKRGLTLGAERP